MSQFNLFGKRIQVVLFAIFKHIPGLIKKKLFHDTKQIKLITNDVFLSYIQKVLDLLLHVIMTDEQYGCSKMTSIWSGKKKNSCLPFKTIKVQKKPV